MAEVPTQYGIILAAILFSLGVAGILLRRNIFFVLLFVEVMLNAAGLAFVVAGARWGQADGFFVLLFVEVMLNAAGLAFVVAGARWGQADGQVMFIFVLATAAAEVAIGLGLLLRLHHQFKTLNVDEASDLRG